MALAPVGCVWLPDWDWVPANANMDFATIVTVNAVGEGYGLIVRAPKTGTLQSFGLHVGGLSLTGTIRLSFQDVDASGFPDGTEDQFRDVVQPGGGMVQNTFFEPSGALTSDGTDTGTKRSVTRGDLIACVADCTAFTSGGVSFIALSQSTAQHTVFPYSVFDAGIGWQKQDTNAVHLSLKYADGTYPFIPNAWPVTFPINDHVFNNTSSPDEIALKIVPMVPMKVGGFKAYLDLDGACDVVLYDENNTVLTSVSLTSGARGATNIRLCSMVFPDEVELTMGRTYRLSFKPTSATSIQMQTMDVPSIDHMALLNGGAAFTYSTRVDGGTWTDSATRRPCASLLVTHLGVIDEPVGAVAM